MTHTTQVLSERQIKDFIDDGLFLDTPNAIARAIESATLKAVSGRVDCGHLFDLRYTLDVLHKVRSMISDQDGAHAELGAAIVGMRYIISRTERTTHTLPPAQPAPVDELVKALRGVIAAHEYEMDVIGEQMRDAGVKSMRLDGPAGECALKMFDAIKEARAALQCAQAPQPTNGQP